MQNISSSAAFADSKPHYELLDGLRGIAALLVIWYHIFEGFATSPIDQRFNHGYLAVDFFFILSGFVVGYAYDDRWKTTMNTKDFFKRRLIRLHPMVILGAVLGAITFCIQGCEKWDGTQVSISMVMLTLLLNLFLIPAVPGSGSEVRGNGEMYPLNGPSWSLFFEYIGNILYALFIRRFSTKQLTVLVILAAVMILISVGVSGYYYATVRDNLVSRAVTASDTFRKYFTDTYDQFYTQAESTVTTFSEQDKLEQQFLDANGRILLSTSGLSGGGLASTEDATQALATQKTSVFTGRDPLSDERVMSVTAPLLSSRGDLVGGVRFITSLRVVERQIWIIIGVSLLACLVFLIFVVASNSYFIRSIVDPVLKINNIAKEIAAGRYGVRLQKTYDDEIGELCDTINYMSDEINRAERMKNDFISSVSHELRTPLTAIGGWSETLLAGGGEDPEEVMQGLTIIQKEAGRLTRMVEELLDFARIESGRMKLEVENFDLSIELYEAVYMYENLLQKSGIRLNYDEDVEANYFVNGDRHRMKQVFLNILDNAAKYGGDGKRIDIRLVRDGGNLVATVRDYGQGIPEAELPFVKEKFYKGSSKQRGSGIGLAVTEEIVVLHGGTLDIASAVGEGTTVTVTLPSAKAEEALGITGAPSRTEEEP